MCAPTDAIAAQSGNRQKKRPPDNENKEKINSSTTPFKRTEANRITLPSDTSEEPNVVTGTASRTRATRYSVLNSTTKAVNVTQSTNFVTESYQRFTQQEIQSVAPYVNDDDDDGNYNDGALPLNLETN